MKSSPLIFGAMLLFITQLHTATAMSFRCRPLDEQRKQDLEAVLERPFRGCKISQRQAMTALERLHWLTPEDVEVPVDLSSNQRQMVKNELNRADFKRVEKKKILRGFRMASKALERPGKLTVSTNCVMELEPDVVTVILASASNPRKFNRMLAKECEKRGISLEGTVRSLPRVVQVVALVRCIMWTIISFFVPFAGQVAIAIMKTVTNSVVVFAPCPSSVARIVYDSAI